MAIMNRDLLELYTDYLLSAFSYTTATGLSAMPFGRRHVRFDVFPLFIGEVGWIRLSHTC